MNELLLTKEDGIGVLTLNRPEVMNALSPEIYDGFEKFLPELDRDDEVRVIVITGKGKAFCSGGDVSTMKARSEQPAAKQWKQLRRMFTNAIKLRELEKPVIAAVNGAAVGAGANLALACDIRIASEHARLGQVFSKRGVTPDWGGTYLLTKLVGPAKACELFFTGRIVDAQEALRIGMVNMVVPADKFEKTWRDFARDIAFNCAPLSLRLSKVAVYRSLEASLDMMIDYEAFSTFFTSKTEDHKEGYRSFLEKRPPNFKGE